MATRKHNTAPTSIKAWHEIVAEGLPVREKDLVCKYLSAVRVPKTSRQIAKALNKERGNITRSLFNLEEEGTVIVSHFGKCATTGKTVKHYQINLSKEQ